MRARPERIDVLPAAVPSSRVTSRMWIAGASALGAASLAFAGFYPAFDGGRLRFVIGLTSLPFGAAVVAAAASSASAKRAFGASVFYAMLLGVASTLIPCFILARNDNMFGLAAVFGTIFGSATGLAYGIVLGIAASLAHKHVQLGTHESADRASRVAAGWLMAVSPFAFVVSLLYLRVPSDAGFHFADDVFAAPALAPPTFAVLVFGIGALVLLRATTRIRRRQAWVERVREGREPKFRIRALDARDAIATLPRLADGQSVVEWCPEGFDSAYRSAASHEAVAVVADVRR